MRVTFPTILACALLALWWGAPAQAATVARSGEYTIDARQTGERLCITLRRDRHYQGEECGRIPRSPQRALSVFADLGRDNYASAVPPSVRFAETEDRRGLRKRFRTFAARGFDARFVLIPSPPRAVFVRFYGADGTLLGIDPGPVGYIDIFANRVPVFGEERGVGVVAHTEARLAPTPDQADRLIDLACIDITVALGGNGACEDSVVLMGSCDGPDLVGGTVGPGVVSVRLTLGSGAVFDLPTRELPAVFGGHRAYGGPVPVGEAVRDATALDAHGLAVSHAVVGTAPGGQPCAGEDRGGDSFAGPLVPVAPPPGAAVVAMAGVELLVADQGERLCVAVHELPAEVCPRAPADSEDPRLVRFGEGVGGVLSRDAARITLRLDRGPDVTVGVTDGPAYTGRWAGKVRFFATWIDPRREVVRAVVRNAAGTIIGTSERGIPRPAIRRTVLAGSLHLVREEGAQPCATVGGVENAPRYCTDLNPGTPIDGPSRPYGGTVVVTCTPRQAIAYGRFPDELATPRVILDGGRAIRARRIRLAGEDAWVAFLPDATVRRLEAGDNAVALRLPPASAQCGYSATRSF